MHLDLNQFTQGLHNKFIICFLRRWGLFKTWSSPVQTRSLHCIFGFCREVSQFYFKFKRNTSSSSPQSPIFALRCLITFILICKTYVYWTLKNILLLAQGAHQPSGTASQASSIMQMRFSIHHVSSTGTNTLMLDVTT